MDLSKGEKFFIDVCRKFNFLLKLNYTGQDFCLNGREYWVTFENSLIKRKVIIILEEPLQFNVYFEREKWFAFNLQSVKFSIIDTYSTFNCEYLNNIESYKMIERNAEFIQQHLMPVIKGEIWIDELIKKK